MALDAHLVASQWLSAFAPALCNADPRVVADQIVTDGWLRDLLTFSWDFRSLEGRDKIVSYLSKVLPSAQVTNVRLDNTPELAPRTSPAQPDTVELAFTFELPHGHCRGYARLLRDEEGVFRALTVMMMLHNLRGHEEILRGPTENPPSKETPEYAKWVQSVETDPHVLIVGAASSGLHMAVRFKQMNISALVIDRLPRVGDIWRGRYPSLTLHTVRRHHSLLYQPFPSDWPEYTPSGQYADWLEHYASVEPVVVWNDTELGPQPRYDVETRRWDVTVVREGAAVHLRPAHIVFASGLGKAIVPKVPNVDVFNGQTFHSSTFPGGTHFVGKHAIVVGSGNSSVDVCHDLALSGAESVTMIQRSPTCVINRDLFNVDVRAIFPEDEPLEISDFKLMTMPIGLFKKYCIAAKQSILDQHKEMHDKLKEKGLRLTMGPEGEGVFILYYTRGGGYWLDKGGADLVADGRIKVKSGVTLERFTENGLVFSDGTELPADVIVFATGYESIRTGNATLLGEDVMKHVGPVYGLDDECEMQGLFRPCGHPGLWFCGGDIPIPRVMSKCVALQIKAIQLGLYTQDFAQETQDATLQVASSH